MLALKQGIEIPLTNEEKNKISHAIGMARQPDDRNPEDVVREDFNGDWDAYYRTMARWHGIQLD